jgi:magnesium-transporting ATPase (P-type)
MTNIGQYIILNNKPYFSLADEFITLYQLFKQETVFETLNFWIDMVVYPLFTLCSILFFKQQLGLFTVMSIHKTVTKWGQYFRYLELKYMTDEWKTIVKSIGGPFISTNDEMYHMYVYADGMQRLHDDLLGSLLLPKERAKRL